MKKRDLFLAGLFLCSVSVFAQVDEDLGLGPNGETEPVRYEDDAKVIFIQGFEGSTQWDTIRLNPDPNRPTTLFTWQSEPVDSIKQITYYKRAYNGQDTGNPSSGTDIYNGDKQWEIAGVRDTTMYLYSGVMRTDAVQPDDSILQAQDTHMLSQHGDESLYGAGVGGEDFGLTRFGEDVNAGANYFTYITGNSDGVANSSSHKTPEYRRNLFVRLDPGTIQELSSYRVTVFVKGKSLNKTTEAVTPTIGLDLMRGYFHSEKSFLVTDKGDRDTFADKVDYAIYQNEADNDKWQKITLMAYYNNDSIGNASAYLLGYYWADDWNWVTPINKETGVVEPGSTDTTTLKFVQQPDKYFVRLAFRSDSTRFDVENLSLTKSWIGGVEHCDDMIRVNFGYETNMSDLAQAALEKNKIAAVELPGEYFDVWARYWDSDEEEFYWEYMPILSAEYHGKYLYMWSKPYSGGQMRDFNEADSVLVSFRNPKDRDDLKLVYKGKFYPNGLDEEWAKTKEVFDFHNEISSLNPTIKYDEKGKTVRSLKNLPPVWQGAQYVDGTFGLSGNMDSIVYKFSRKLYYGNTNGSFVTVSGNGYTEYWTITSYDGGRTVIKRPAADKSLHGDLKGDYVIYFDQITHLNDADLTVPEDYGNDYSQNLHFGTFDDDPKIELVKQSDWRGEIIQEGEWARPVPASLWCYYYDSGKAYFYNGTGENKNPSNTSDYWKCGLYKMQDDGKNGNALFYLSGRTNNNFGHLYTVENLKAGYYQIEFSSFGWSRQNDIKLYVYAQPDQMTYEKLEASNKKQFGTYKPSYDTSWSGNNTEEKWNEKVERFSFGFFVPSDGNYVIEWETPKEGSQSYYGVAIGNYTLSSTGIPSVVKLNKALAEAKEKIQLGVAEPKKYQGTQYTNLQDVYDNNSNFINQTIAANLVNGLGHVPASYDSVVNVINAAIDLMQKQIDLVDAFFKADSSARAKLDIYADSLKVYQGFAVVSELQDLVTIFDGYNASIKTPEQITEDTKKLTDAIAAVEARQALNDKLAATIVEAEELRDSVPVKELVGTSDEYAALVNVIDGVKTIDDVAALDEEISILITGLQRAMLDINLVAYNQELKPYLADVATKRIQLLDSLATALGVEFDADMQGRIAEVDFDDDELADDMKEAIVEAIYNRAAAGNPWPVDLTGFIKNYYLYVTPILNEVSSVTKDDGNTLKNATINTPGAQIQHIEHRWNTNQVWGVILDKEFINLYPGWTFKADDNGGSGNRYVTPDEDNYGHFVDEDKTNYMAFDGQVAMDWNSKAELKQIVTGLPIGTYTLSVNIKDNGNGSSTSLEAAAEGKSIKKNPSGNGLLSIDGIDVLRGYMSIDFILASGNNWSKADDFTLTFTPLEGYDYAEIATVIDFVPVEAAGEYEYYTLNWIKVEYPEKNQIYFRKSGNVVEKVIFK